MPDPERYARHIVLKGIGGNGQNKLSQARVLIVGAGGLGSPAIAYLAAAGVGTLGIADFDTVALSNLQRQIIHTTASIGTSKTASAAAFAEALNPDPNIIRHDEEFAAGNADSIVAEYQLVLDCTDNLAARRTTAAAAANAKVPLVTGAVSMYDGQLTCLAPYERDCEGRHRPQLSDIFPADIDEAGLLACEQTGVLGATTGVIGSLMAVEAIKLITGTGEPLFGRLLLYDGRSARFTEITYARNSSG